MKKLKKGKKCINNSAYSTCSNNARSGKSMCHSCWLEWQKEVKKYWGITPITNTTRYAI